MLGGLLLYVYRPNHISQTNVARGPMLVVVHYISTQTFWLAGNCGGTVTTENGLADILVSSPQSLFGVNNISHAGLAGPYCQPLQLQVVFVLSACCSLGVHQSLPIPRSQDVNTSSLFDYIPQWMELYLNKVSSGDRRFELQAVPHSFVTRCTRASQFYTISLLQRDFNAYLHA